MHRHRSGRGSAAKEALKFTSVWVTRHDDGPVVYSGRYIYATVVGFRSDKFPVTMDVGLSEKKVLRLVSDGFLQHACRIKEALVSRDMRDFLGLNIPKDIKRRWRMDGPQDFIRRAEQCVVGNFVVSSRLEGWKPWPMWELGYGSKSPQTVDIASIPMAYPEDFDGVATSGSFEDAHEEVENFLFADMEEST